MSLYTTAVFPSLQPGIARSETSTVWIPTLSSSSSFLHLTKKRLPRTLQEGKQFHSQIFKFGSESNIFFINFLIHLYADNGNLEYARQLFDESSQRDVVSWTSLISGYAKFRKMGDARNLFDEMPDRNAVSWNAMVAGYGKSGDINTARQLFDEMPERDIVSWNSMISGYAHNGFLDEAFEMFRAMMVAGMTPNKVSFLSLLPAIAGLGHIFRGKCVHAFMIKSGIKVDSVLCSAILDMYSKCGCLEMAFLLFETNPQEDAASWNAMLAGFVRNNCFKEALDFFQWMQAAKVKANYVTMVTILPAIASLGALDHGKWVHSYIERKGIKINATLGSALVVMYSKCGCIEISLQLFNMINNKTIELWNAMIAGLAIHGRGKDAIRLFYQMQELDLNFDDITLAAVLNACSHSGLVNEGLHLFASVEQLYNITPKIQHYGCVVDLLGRAGLLKEAKELISSMPIKPDAVIWKSLLGACKIHGNVDIGELAARNLIELYPSDSSSYVLMSNIYDAATHSKGAIVMRKMMSYEGIRKTPGCSSIELDGMVHEFLVGDKSHTRTAEIYAMLDEMAHELKLIGYVPDTKLVLFDIEEVEKEAALYHHSEKLAIAFGLISSGHGTPLRIVKNLRMCSDCHLVTKLLSRIYDRAIIIRDHRRFHHFRNGSCSCMDYW